MTPDDLTDGEKASPAFVKMMRKAQERLDLAQADLEKTIDLERTNVIRGRIKEIRWLLSLHEDTPVITPTRVDFD